MKKWKRAAYTVAAEDLETTYGNWISGWIDVGEMNHVLLQLTYSDTDATTIELKLETEQDADTDGYELWRVSGGTLSLDEIQATVANLPADGQISVEIEAWAFRRFRVLGKQTGGAQTGNTLAMEVLAGG